jgi:hypothetical protein
MDLRERFEDPSMELEEFSVPALHHPGEPRSVDLDRIQNVSAPGFSHPDLSR